MHIFVNIYIDTIKHLSRYDIHFFKFHGLFNIGSFSLDVNAIVSSYV